MIVILFFLLNTPTATTNVFFIRSYFVVILLGLVIRRQKSWENPIITMRWRNNSNVFRTRSVCIITKQEHTLTAWKAAARLAGWMLDNLTTNYSDYCQRHTHTHRYIYSDTENYTYCTKKMLFSNTFKSLCTKIIEVAVV